MADRLMTRLVSVLVTPSFRFESVCFDDNDKIIDILKDCGADGLVKSYEEVLARL
ncbi:hypothetical protein ACFL0Q_00620 [Thermodesulfobacteriota bacterium]